MLLRELQPAGRYLNQLLQKRKVLSVLQQDVALNIQRLTCAGKAVDKS
jgi:hypothetical protein